MNVLLALALGASLLTATAAQPRLPRVIIGEQKSIDYLSESTEWEDSGGPNGHISLDAADARAGSKALHFNVNVSWHNPGPYPKGWPSFQLVPKPALDFTGYDMIRFWVKADSSNPVGDPVFRFILWTGDTGRLNAPVPGLKWGEWKQVAIDLSAVPFLDNVTKRTSSSTRATSTTATGSTSSWTASIWSSTNEAWTPWTRTSAA